MKDVFSGFLTKAIYLKACFVKSEGKAGKSQQSWLFLRFRRPYPTLLTELAGIVESRRKPASSSRRGISLQRGKQSKNRGFFKNMENSVFFDAFRRPELSETPRIPSKAVESRRQPASTAGFLIQ